MGRAFEYRKAAKLKRWGTMSKTLSKVGEDDYNSSKSWRADL